MDDSGQNMLLAIIYTGREMITFNDASRKINLVISRLLKELKAS
jgi:hypothetical protein